MEETPRDGWAGLRRHFGSEIISGFVICLIALPLSVGIAIASGAPPTAGILAAMIGGMIGGLLGGSYLTINGPAAGLIVVVLGAVQDLGAGDNLLGFRRMLAATVVAGVIQIAFGIARWGILGTIVPGSVIHGMLTAIGIIVMVKQVPVVLGATPASKTILGMMSEIPHMVSQLNPEVALIAAVGFVILVGAKTWRRAWALWLPAPLLAAVVGMGLASLFDFGHEHLVTSHWQTFAVGPKLLLNLPESIARAFVFPDFSVVFTLASLRWTLALAMVASIEALLTASAVDRMDPWKRTSNLDRELVSKGICNLLCGLVGGLPIIAEMVRSSANVSQGARTRWANFFHGFFMLLFLVCFPSLLHRIPLAALGAILITVGYSLARPVQFFHVAKIGKDHFAAFMATLVITVVSDLLLGVIAGLAVEVAFCFARGVRLKELFHLQFEEVENEGRRTLRVNSPLIFTNFLRLKPRLVDADSANPVELDLEESLVIDHTSLDQLQRLSCELRFSENHRPASTHPAAARTKRRGSDGVRGL